MPNYCEKQLPDIEVLAQGLNAYFGKVDHRKRTRSSHIDLPTLQTWRLHKQATEPSDSTHYGQSPGGSKRPKKSAGFAARR